MYALLAAVGLASCSTALPPSGDAQAPERAAGSSAPAAARDVTSEITRAELEAHVRFLAADELRGRATGTPEEDRAAAYLAKVLEEAGLEPAGDDGGFLQRVPLERITVDGRPELAATTTAGEEIALESRRDFDVRGPSGSTGALRVRVVRSASDVPREPDAAVALFLDGPQSRVRDWLEAADQPEGQGWGLLIRPGSEEARPPSNRDRSSSLRRVAPRGAEATWIRAHGTLLARLRAGEIREVALITRTRREPVDAHNVVARLSGRGTPADPGLAERALVISAHFDHIGVREAGGDEAEDLVFNGADDNASGVAAVLEIAEAFATGPPPALDVVFLLATGEELGLFGTDAYIDDPSVPLERTAYDLNLEMIGRPDELAGGRGVLWLVGWDLTNVGPALAAAGLAIVPDPRPEQMFFWRSDNVSFVRRGVVAQSLSSYGMHTDYHQTSDEAATLDYEHLEACTRIAYRAARSIADGELTPAWRGGAPPGRER